MMLNYLEFEQPIAELEAKIDELRNVSRNGDYDLGLEEEINKLKEKSQGPNNRTGSIGKKANMTKRLSEPIKTSRHSPLLAYWPAACWRYTSPTALATRLNGAAIMRCASE